MEPVGGQLFLAVTGTNKFLLYMIYIYNKNKGCLFFYLKLEAKWLLVLRCLYFKIFVTYC